MKLIVRRSQSWGGFWGNQRLFCMDVIGTFSEDELATVCRYGLRCRHLYTSEHWRDKHAAILPLDHFIFGNWTANELVSSVSASITLDKAYHITVGDLVDGTHIHATSLEELNQVYALLIDGAKVLDAYLRQAVTFESRGGEPGEELVDLAERRA